jgi:MoxR-like ATPase
MLELLTAVFVLIATSPLTHANECSALFLEKEATRKAFMDVRRQLNTKVLGQDEVVTKLLIALLTKGHVLIEGPPGGAKSRLAGLLATSFHAKAKKEQFTPDTSPSELKGTEIYNSETRAYEFHPGSLHANIFLADEINRAMPKTQSALLSAMEEGKVPVGGNEHALPDVYMVVATQNPDSHVGTNPLPEAQRDRFMFKLQVYHPDVEVEHQILDLILAERLGQHKSLSDAGSTYSLDMIRAARHEVLSVRNPDPVRRYLLALVDATRNPVTYPGLETVAPYIQSGAGTRAAIAFELGARASAWLSGRNEVQISDVDFIAKDILRHRIVLSQDAHYEQKTPDYVIEEITKAVKRKLMQ